ncbi:MAG: hypothetical protein M0Z85_02780 [Gammaproteobacteria bacterium]|nr:hypothetical protein [Gammaproteobacteria bacterium]
MGVAEPFAADGSSESTTTHANPYVEEALAWLGRLSAYMSERDINAMRQDLERRIREHPGASIAIGFGVGVILGKLLSR